MRTLAGEGLQQGKRNGEPAMPSSPPYGTDELTGALQEQGRVQEEITAIQQTISLDEIWLRMNTPVADEYQDIVEELLALQTYLVELWGQAASLERAVRELTLGQVS
jgi:hypothetical protein